MKHAIYAMFPKSFRALEAVELPLRLTSPFVKCSPERATRPYCIGWTLQANSFRESLRLFPLGH